MLLVALVGATTVALLTVVLFALTIIPRPSAILPNPQSQGVYYAVFSPDGATLAAADDNGSTYLWNVAARKVTAILPDPDPQGWGQSR